jgi:hypothetical protein
MTRGVYKPRPARVHLDPGGSPIDAVREQWLVEDRWWTAHPIRRRYFELTTPEGTNKVVFCDLENERWFSQRGA